uniref:Uncharacterized protein n=1 Tax=Oryza barthii TaxID=65489 RepID=A0A0D3HKJ4_9ORYZ
MDDYYDTLDAFLFYLPDPEAAPVVELPKVGGSGAALTHCSITREVGCSLASTDCSSGRRSPP